MIAARASSTARRILGARVTRPQMPLPYGWSPRPYQLGMWHAMDEGCKRLALVWHRRAGKDLTCIHRTVLEAMRRPGNYYHCLPTYNQGRKVVWDGKDFHGRPFLDAFPRELIARRSNSDMVIDLTNGSHWQVVGADNIDRVVGVNLCGVVFSEWSLMSPSAYDYLRPVLRENRGWAIFIYTPRGRNHGWDLWDMARRNDGWYAELLTVDDTGAVSPEDIDADRREGMSEELIRQEYYCDFSATAAGSYYGRLIDQMRDQGRIGTIPHDPTHRVHTAWDIGYDDSTAIWFFQVVPGGWIRCLHYLEHHGEGLPYYAARLQQLAADRGWVYGRHFGPHDLAAHDVATGRTRKSIASELGIQFVVLPRIKAQQDGIEAVRSVLPRAYMDEAGCSRGIRALESYHQEYDSVSRKWLDHPEHDWSSHGAKAFEALAFGVRQLGGSDSDMSADEVRRLYLRNAPPSVREVLGGV